ncbi:response regulator transcription factor [Nocardioides sp. IC4_145]|uniref:LuxR C-terminal-related transcriptional regulator n=1 Tax=Nocardioides sp. IC4_145 TaxID=2714037 RepID=UPI00140D0188|nr:response regulator transcription factor [Nocardioides sp. IC4_145]NHC25242.1 response regulator transcription factor [Nocardioides sp. IC4_145]
MSRLPARKETRVLIIDDHTLFAESLELALSVEGYDAHRAEERASGTSAAAVLAAAVRMHPRIVLLDLDLGPSGDGARMISPLLAAGAQVVVVTACVDRARWGGCLRHGARQVVSKSRPLNEILSVVRRVSQGLPVIDHAERDRLIRLWFEQRRELEVLAERLRSLTNREREVLDHLMQGHTVREIAVTSVVSEATVRTQVKSILAKLEVSSQLAAVGMAHALQWRPPSSHAVAV